MDNFRPLLAAMIRQLFEAEPLDDVRAATAHGTRLISPYDALTLRERGTTGGPTVTLRKGSELDANAKALERHLCQKAHESGRTVSTLDRLENDQAQALADSYRAAPRCVSPPFACFRREFGMLTLHYDSRMGASSMRSSMPSERSGLRGDRALQRACAPGPAGLRLHGSAHRSREQAPARPRARALA
jgi:hypothetical protein